MTVPAIWITPEADLDAVLQRAPNATLFSFGSPSRPSPMPQARCRTRHAFAFNDIAEPQDGLVPPDAGHVTRLVTLLREGGHGPLVFQCWFGVSRSAAAATIACCALGLAAPSRVAERLRHTAPWATPNPLMIAHADALLGLEGALSEAVRSIGRGVQTSTGRAVRLDLG